ncbi:MAG: class I SAM-dependent methyltransferase [Rhodospirillaceae bacterium]
MAASDFWRPLFKTFNPKTFLEVGCFEGRSSCFILDHAAPGDPITLHCIDSWRGSQEFQDIDMAIVEARFDANIALALGNRTPSAQFRKIKALSTLGLATLIAEGRTDHYDFIYLDGSHRAPDVLSDAVMAFPLLKSGGLMVFDDYLWEEEKDRTGNPLDAAKPGIDVFMNLFSERMTLIPDMPNCQLFTIKL